MNRIEKKYCVPRELSKKEKLKKYQACEKRIIHFLKKYKLSHNELSDI